MENKIKILTYSDLSPIEKQQYMNYESLSLDSLRVLKSATTTLLSPERKAALDKAILDKEQKQAAFRMKTGNDLVISLMLN